MSSAARNYLLNNDSPFIGEVIEIGLKSQVIVDRLHIGREHLPTLCDVDGRVPLHAKLFAHVSSMRTMSD